jgi:DNA-binding NtrC family response regulator
MEINTVNEDEMAVLVKLPMDLADVLEKFQAAILTKTMNRFGGNRSQAAKALGLHRTTLISKAKRHGLIAKQENTNAAIPSADTQET